MQEMWIMDLIYDANSKNVEKVFIKITFCNKLILVISASCNIQSKFKSVQKVSRLCGGLCGLYQRYRRIIFFGVGTSAKFDSCTYFSAKCLQPIMI